MWRGSGGHAAELAAGQFARSHSPERHGGIAVQVAYLGDSTSTVTEYGAKL